MEIVDHPVQIVFEYIRIEKPKGIVLAEACRKSCRKNEGNFSCSYG